MTQEEQQLLTQNNLCAACGASFHSEPFYGDARWADDFAPDAPHELVCPLCQFALAGAYDATQTPARRRAEYVARCLSNE